MSPDRNFLKTDLRVALGFFALAAGLGVLLRSFPLFEIPLTYKYLVHAHSHLILLAQWGGLKLGRGWVTLYMLGFIATEALLVYRGLCGWMEIMPFAETPVVLWAGSLLLFAGVLGLWLQSLGSDRKAVG